MSESLPKAPSAQALREQADATIAAYRSYLDSPAFQHSIDLAVLVKIAGDDSVDIRERRRAAEVLAKLRLQAMEGLAALTGVREQALDALGIKAPGQGVALTQINNKIEIVRASDWRNAEPLEQGADVIAEVLPAGEPASNSHAASGHVHAREEVRDGDDPPA